VISENIEAAATAERENLPAVGCTSGEPRQTVTRVTALNTPAPARGNGKGGSGS